MLILFLVLILILSLILSQFGKTLPAGQALPWWTAALFLVVAVLVPDSLLPIAQLLGVQLVSNLVFAALILFLLSQNIQAQAECLKLARKIRLMTSKRAAKDFLGQRKTTEVNQDRALIVLPTYNEERSLPQVIRALQSLPSRTTKGIEIDFCFVNDGSTDGSEEVLRTLAPQHFVSHDVNMNVGGVLLTGFKIAQLMTFQYVIQCDADGQHPIEVIPSLLDKAVEEKSDLLIGSRFLNVSQDAASSTTQARLVGITVIRFWLKMFHSGKGVTDPTSGFRVYSARAMRLLVAHMPDEYPEPESIALLHLNNLNVTEEFVRMSPRVEGVSSLSGLKSVHYMVKVTTSLIAMRIRHLIRFI